LEKSGPVHLAQQLVGSYSLDTLVGCCCLS
jgi:hypothetical protein